jgi:hypothetical protein
MPSSHVEGDDVLFLVLIAGEVADDGRVVLDPQFLADAVPVVAIKDVAVIVILDRHQHTALGDVRLQRVVLVTRKFVEKLELHEQVLLWRGVRVSQSTADSAAACSGGTGCATARPGRGTPKPRSSAPGSLRWMSRNASQIGVVSVLCSGCGQPLPVRGERGRPARYHDAACRQRARRARLASDQGALLAALSSVEGATAGLRAAVLTGGDTTVPARTLAQAAAQATALVLPSEPAVPTPRVTKTVTRSQDGNDNKDRQDAPPSPARRRRRSAAPAAIDPDTVRLTRETDPVSPGWHVHGRTATGDEVRIGFLEQVYSARGTRSGRWQARTAGTTLVPGGPWPTRQKALVNLVLDYQHRADVRRQRGR